jgi:hypothetical protein
MTNNDPAKENGSPKYRGDIAQVSVPKIFLHFVAAKSTGRLLFKMGSSQREVFLVAGKISAVTSNQRKDLLGQHLLRAGVITETQLLAFLKKGSQERLGDLLLREHVLTSHELLQYLTNQFRERIHDLFTWNSGQYEFYEGQTHPDSSLAIQASPWEIIAAGMMKSRSLTELRNRFASSNDNVLSQKQNPHVPVQEMSLQPRQLKLFALAAGQKTLGAILKHLCTNDEEEQLVLATIHLGMELDLLALAETPASQPLPLPSHSSPRPTTAEERKLEQELKRIEELNFFDRLSVKDTASAAEVSSAFLKAARVFHPDNTPQNASETCRELSSKIFSLFNEAQQTLSNEEKKKKYIATLSDGGESEATVDVAKILQAEELFHKGEVLVRQAKYAPALLLFKQASLLNPEEGEYFIYQAYAEFFAQPGSDLQRQRECMNMLVKGQKMRNNAVANGHLFLGRMHKALGDLENARACFTEAVSLEKNNTEALRELRLMDMRGETKSGTRKKK